MGRIHLCKKNKIIQKKKKHQKKLLFGWVVLTYPSLTMLYHVWLMPIHPTTCPLPQATDKLQLNRSWSTLTDKIIFGFTIKVKLCWIHSNPSNVHICLDYKAGKISVRMVEPPKKHPPHIRRWNADIPFFPIQRQSKSEIRNRLSIKKAAGKIKTIKHVVGISLLYISQIPTGKNAM